MAHTRKEVIGLFVDARGKILKADSVCSFKGNAYEPNIFTDSKRNEFFFTCTVQGGGVANADFNLRPGLNMVVLTKRDAKGAHASNTETAETKNFVGYTNNTLAKTSGYYNERTDRYVSPNVGNMSDFCVNVSICVPTPPLTQKQSTDNKSGLMLGLGRERY